MEELDNLGMQYAQLITTAEAELTIVRSHTPVIYVPRRFRIGGLADIRQGSAIVGTPQGEGTVAIDVESTPYVDPTPEIWATWVAEAAHRHVTAEEDLPAGEEMQTVFVSEHDLVEVGLFDNAQVLITDEVGGARLSVWIESGRAAYMAQGLFPHQGA